ncbi:MAG TPA: CPBP family intramembrane glutamic endopeptidase [Acidimicrobiia bacterium]|nr:CPBP family intramembrane glutamic endopeptidase [Acidimicrobiia bacterium]
MPWRTRDFWLAMFAGIGSAILATSVMLAVDGSTSALLVTVALAQYVGHLGTLWLLGRRRGGLETLGLSVEVSDLRYVFLGLLLQITIPIIFFPLANLVSEGEGGQIISDQLRSLDTTYAKVIMAAVLAVLAPLTEELLFRGVLQRSIGTGLRAIWLTAGLFAVFHLGGLTGDFFRSLVLTMPTFLVMGLVLSYVTVRQKRLGPAIFIHSGFNLLALVVFFLPTELVEEILSRQT